MTSRTLGKIAGATTLQQRYALAWQYLAEAHPSKTKRTPSGYHSPWMCWRMLYVHAGQGTRSSQINKAQCWEIVCSYVNSKGGAA